MAGVIESGERNVVVVKVSPEFLMEHMGWAFSDGEHQPLDVRKISVSNGLPSDSKLLHIEHVWSEGGCYYFYFAHPSFKELQGGNFFPIVFPTFGYTLWAGMEHEPIKDTYACQRCGRRDGLDAVAPNDVWKRIQEEGNGENILCLWCMDQAADSLGIQSSVSLHFAGRALTGTSDSEANADHVNRLTTRIEELENELALAKGVADANDNPTSA